MASFEIFNLHPTLFESLTALGFKETTPVQELTIPLILKNRDLIACAQTGTGKTAAFLIPVLQKIIEADNFDGTKLLVVVPTRELAIQIDSHVQGLSYFLPVSSIAVYGGGDGDSWEQQKRAIDSGVNIVIATPGRLISLINLGYLKSASLISLVLDEADRMLDMGFYEDIIKIIKSLDSNHQTLMFSATMPPKIRQLAKTILKDPDEINISISKPAEGVIQGAYLIHDQQKPDLIKHLLKDKPDIKSILIFSATKVAVKLINRQLKGDGFSCSAIHSDLTQDERIAVLSGFKNKNIRILVATDIVSRGIDIDNIDLVINYDVPSDAEDYVHRVGRTARAANTGVALTFINSKDINSFKNIETLIGNEVYKLPLPPEMKAGPDYLTGYDPGESRNTRNRGVKPKNRYSSNNDRKKRTGRL